MWHTSVEPQPAKNATDRPSSLCRRERRREGLERHGLIVVEESFAHTKEIRLGGHAPNEMKKLAGGFDAQSEVVQVFLHFLHVRIFTHLRRANGFIKCPHIRQHIQAARDTQGFAALELPNLVK